MGINDYLKAIQRRWPAVVVAGLLGLLIGYLVAPGAANRRRQLLGDSNSAPGVGRERSGRVHGVARHLRRGRRAGVGNADAHPAPQQLLPHIAAVGDKTSSSIEITASGAQPQAAVALANAFAQATVDEFLARHRDAAAARFKSLEGQLTDVKNQLKQVAAPLPAVTGQACSATQAAALSARYVAIYGLLQDTANQANRPTGLEILNPAAGAASTAGAFACRAPRRTMRGPDARRLVLGAALALALEHFDTRPRDQAAARRAYRLPVLVEIPKVRAQRTARLRGDHRQPARKQRRRGVPIAAIGHYVHGQPDPPLAARTSPSTVRPSTLPAAAGHPRGERACRGGEDHHRRQPGGVFRRRR